MPEKKTMEEARTAKRQGKSPSTQAGAFVHEEIEHVREGKHGARSAKQAIAIGLSKARRAGGERRARAGPVTRGARGREAAAATEERQRADEASREARQRARRQGHAAIGV